MVFNLNHQHFVSSLSYAKRNFFYFFPRISNSLADLLMLVSLRNEANVLNFERILPLNELIRDKKQLILPLGE